MMLPRWSYIALAVPLILAMGYAGVGLAAKPKIKMEMVPEGEFIQVRLDQTLASNQSRSGDTFEASVATPIEVGGKVVIPEGTPVQGRVVYARHSGRLSGVAQLRLTLNSLQVDQTSYELHTNTIGRHGGNHKKRNIVLIGGGGGAGALIGAIAAGGKGALIGGPVGAGAGTAAAALTGKKDFVLPAETRLSFRLHQSLTLPVKS
jgi:hypothetical protein